MFCIDTFLKRKLMPKKWRMEELKVMLFKTDLFDTEKLRGFKAQLIANVESRSSPLFQRTTSWLPEFLHPSGAIVDLRLLIPACPTYTNVNDYRLGADYSVLTRLLADWRDRLREVLETYARKTRIECKRAILERLRDTVIRVDVESTDNVDRIVTRLRNDYLDEGTPLRQHSGLSASRDPMDESGLIEQLKAAIEQCPIKTDSMLKSRGL
jgi:hypothetical protein